MIVEHKKFLHGSRKKNLKHSFSFYIAHQFVKKLHIKFNQELMQKIKVSHIYKHTPFPHTHQLVMSLALFFLFHILFQYCLFHLHENECMQIFFHLKILIFTPFYLAPGLIYFITIFRFFLFGVVYSYGCMLVE